MYWKPKQQFLGVLLFYAITTITSEPTGPPLRQGPQASPEPLHPDPLQADTDSAGPPFSSLDPPESRPRPGMVAYAGDWTVYKPTKKVEEGISSLLGTPQGNCSEGEIQHVLQGKFYIPGQVHTKSRSSGFQSDSAVPVQPQRGRPRVRGQRVSSPAESWQKLQPVVECGDESMTLTVRKRRAVQLLLDRANESSVPLLQLAPHCGYSVQTTSRDLSLTSQYDACHITQEDDNYILSLLWRGTPVRMSCPASQIALQPERPSSLCCSPYGMTVRVPGRSATDQHRINVRGEWTPLAVLAEHCGYTLDRQGSEMAIAAPFATCGISVKDEKYTLALEAGNDVYLLVCPITPYELLPITHQSLLNSPPHGTSMSNTPIPESLESFPWAPPFYLAPPYYPHPTSQHGSAQPEVMGSLRTLVPPTVHQKSLFWPRSRPGVYPRQHDPQKLSPHEHLQASLLPVEETANSGASYLETKQENEKRNQEMLVVNGQHGSRPTGFPTQVEAPHVQPPQHDYNPYYHYYHHPKIPVHATSLQDPGPQLSGEPSTVEIPVPRASVPQLVHKPPTNPHGVPANSPIPHKDLPRDALRRAQLYPYYYLYHLPHVVGETRRLSQSHPVEASTTNVLGSPVPPIDEYATRTDIPDDSKYKSEQHSTYSPSLTDDDVKPVMEDLVAPVPRSSLYGADLAKAPPPEQPFSSTVNYNSNPYQYYHHYPYYDYHRLPYGPQSFSVYNGVPQTPQKTMSQMQESPFLTMPSPVRSLYHFQNGVRNPYFGYHQYSQLEGSRRDVARSLPPNRKESDEALSQPEPTSPINIDYNAMQWFTQELGRPNIDLPTYNSFLNLYQQGPGRQLGPVEQSGSQEVLDNEMEDHTRAGLPPPAASPCGFQSASDPECGNSLDCCVHPVQDCTVGQYFLFVVPESVVEPTVVPTTGSSEGSSDSCMLQRLTSDLDIYAIPLDGCGVNKHIFGSTVLRLLEVQGIHPYRDGNSAPDILPVRLTVGCSSSPGEVMFHVMDQLPPPTPAAIFVRLRIATDESFTRYHPETHLPLGLIRGRPVYLELSLFDPPEPGLVLLVHSCLAYTQEPHASWMLVYDGCQNEGASTLLPALNSHHIQRITISSFLSLPPQSSLHAGQAGGSSFTEDPEIYFMCLTEVCNAAGGDCSLNCFKSRPSHVQVMK